VPTSTVMGSSQSGDSPAAPYTMHLPTGMPMPWAGQECTCCGSGSRQVHRDGGGLQEIADSRSKGQSSHSTVLVLCALFPKRWSASCCLMISPAQHPVKPDASPNKSGCTLIRVHERLHTHRSTQLCQRWCCAVPLIPAPPLPQCNATLLPSVWHSPPRSPSPKMRSPSVMTARRT
jgi:hypothetical protein